MASEQCRGKVVFVVTNQAEKPNSQSHHVTLECDPVPEETAASLPNWFLPHQITTWQKRDLCQKWRWVSCLVVCVGLTFLVFRAGPVAGPGESLGQARGNEVHAFLGSSVVHQRADWDSIHEKICQLLIPLRTTMPFYNSEEERQHGLQQLRQRQVSPTGLLRG